MGILLHEHKNSIKLHEQPGSQGRQNESARGQVVRSREGKDVVGGVQRMGARQWMRLQSKRANKWERTELGSINELGQKGGRGRAGRRALGIPPAGDVLWCV